MIYMLCIYLHNNDQGRVETITNWISINNDLSASND